uniref:Uncharacterized protein n=1 Tax=Tanacetum cinerariifolium TaxID=118510 RepID=A0A6L2KYD7_TANCI|nr:hypothetical protein [Tanacetum cinerariifolium]
MASFDYRLNPLYPIKECSYYGALYTTDYCCSEGILEDKIICDLDKTPDLSQRSPQNCTKCGNPIDDSSEPSNNNTNVVNALRNPFVVEQDPEEHEANINTQPFQYSVVPQTPQEEMSVEFLQEKRNQMDSVKTFLRKFNRISFYEMPKELAVYINTPNWDRPTICYDDDEEDYAIASSVESLVPIPSESEGIPDNMCDVPFHDNSPPLDVLKDHFEDFSNSNDDSTSNDDDSFSIDNIEYVEASPPNSKLISSEVMEIVITEVGGIDDDILLTIKDDILREKLLNINLLITNIEALNDNPTTSSDLMTKSSSTSLNSLLEETKTFDNSLSVFEIFCFDLEEISSDSTTTRSDIFLLKYEVFYDDHVKEISSGSTTTHSDYL